MRWIMTAVVLLTALFAFGSCDGNNEPEIIRAEFDRIAETGNPDAFSKYRLICFNDSTGLEMRDFAAAAKKAGVDLDKSLSTCGVGMTCCGAKNSDALGVIGLVRDEEIRCVAFWKFGYVLEGTRAVCIEPSRLKISREIFQSVPDLRGRPWRPQIGDSYYKIEEQQP